ncbi:MAG: hypothetical protein GYA33_09110 [Thermogutta sp.]|nr:hypothetical protein [Thermogutta sp.]
MSRRYAGVLGPLAMTCVLIHGLIHGAPPDGVLLRAWLSLWGFALLGAIIGAIAERSVRESVEQRLRGELAARSGKNPQASLTTPGSGA